MTALDLTPHQITIMTTSECNARCAHCSVSSGPDRQDALTASDIIAAIDAITSYAPLRLVVFAGGEPTLLGEDLLDAIAHVDSKGIATRIVSNASWATTEELARAMLIELREAGLDSMPGGGATSVTTTSSSGRPGDRASSSPPSTISPSGAMNWKW
jgi:MoaA/NifB/PqqE/SkfB family radical SAM enzyme